MIYVLIFIGIILCIIGAIEGTDRYGDDNCFTIGGTVLIIVSMIALTGLWGSYTYNKNTIDSRLEVIEEQNAIILAQVEPVVQKALEYESNTYKELKINSERLIALGNMYPNLKDNTFIQTQLQIIINNQEIIRNLKLTKAKMNGYRFWIWTKLE